MRLGIFLCTCGKTSNINFKDVKKSISSSGVVEIHDELCQGEGLAYIVDDVRRKELDTVVIGCTVKNQVFEELIEKWELKSDLFFLNLREHCGWVHEKREATEKAKYMVNAAINRVKNTPNPISITADVGDDVLIVGSNSVALKIAKVLSRFANVKLLTKGLQPSCEICTSPVFWDPKRELLCLDDLKIYFGSIKEAKGSIGDFSLEILEGNIDQDKCIECGRCVKACSRNAIQFGLKYFITDLCDKCGKCINLCPTGAIDFSEKETYTINAGQILVIDPEEAFTPRKGIYVVDYQASDIDIYATALSASLNIVSNLGKTKVPKMIEVNLDNCASGKSGIVGCLVCEAMCPHDAITREGDKIVFNEDRCLACGICASACPISLPQLLGHSDNAIYSLMETLLSPKTKMLEPKVLLFACSECGSATLDAVGRKRLLYHPVLPLFVPCISFVSEAHILRAFDLGADGVLLLGCEDCSHDIRLGKSAARFANTTLTLFNLGERVKLMQGNADEPEIFVKTVMNFVKGLSPSLLKGKEPIRLDMSRKRDAILALLRGFSVKTNISPSFIEKDTSFPFAGVFIDSSKCTFCDTCVNMCPMEAIRKRDGDKINFIYGYCIACGLCEKACPERALRLESIIDFAKLINLDEKTLVQPELIKCLQCRNPFMTKKTFELMSSTLRKTGGADELNLEKQLELLEYCENCRPAMALEKFLEKQH